jgi:uncharacterized protein
MQINRDIDLTHYTIQSYAEGSVTIVIPRRFDTRPPVGATRPPAGEPRRKTFYRSIVVMPDRLITDWPPQCWEDLAATHFEQLAADESVEIVLFGSGARLRHPEPHLTAGLIDRGIGVEVMDTGSACRTYNFLMADRRRVAAALLMIRGATAG